MSIPNGFVKPQVELVGADGNIFNLGGIAGKALRRAGYPELATEMYSRITKAPDYHGAIAVILEYVDQG